MNKLYYDAHFHLIPSYQHTEIFCSDGCIRCTAAHTKDEFIQQDKLIHELNLPVFQSFGLHPQNPLIENIGFLEELLREQRISCVGEAGFDLFTETFKADVERQTEAWNAQLDLCIKYNVPVLIHSRKALDRIFRDTKKLKKLPAVIFHSFSGSVPEAESFINRGINAYFSFGKPLLNGAKRAIQCTSQLPSDRLLLETDAPFQTLKNETFTYPEEIKKVYKRAMEIRNIKESSEIDFFVQLEKNFKDCFLPG